MREPLYVYIAAPMSGPPAEYLANCARLSRYSRYLIDGGLCPINPAGDLLEGLMSTEPLTDAQYKARSMDLLRLLADRNGSVHVLATIHRDGRRSEGVAAEIAEAERLRIPVCHIRPADSGWWTR